MTINCDGISLANIGGQSRREIMGVDGNERNKYLVHSLESSNYLKIDANNFIHFQFAGDTKIISTVHQYTKLGRLTGYETAFEPILKIQIHTLTLRELLLFGSLYHCKS